MAKKGVPKWPIFGPPKLTKWGFPKLGGSKIWPKPLKMTYFGSLFGPLFGPFIPLPPYLRPHMRGFSTKRQKRVQKVVQKVGFGVSRTPRDLQKLDILSSKCQVLTHFLTTFWPIFWPKMGQKMGQKRGPKMGPSLGPYISKSAIGEL